MSLSRFVSRLVVAAAATTVLAAVPALAAAQDSVAAVWVPKKLEFVYQGFGTRYSCDGLRAEIRSMLRKLGAQALEVREMPCSTGAGVPSPYPSIWVKMRVLVPASSAEAAKAESAGAPLRAHWQKVVLLRSSLHDAGNCQLMEQFKQRLLPLFTTRNIKYSADCVPYQPNLDAHLSAEVLMPPKGADGSSG
ncbi:MAG: hypothetical protein ACRES6_03085 [Steroidobacteraceae bacterium]